MSGLKLDAKALAEAQVSLETTFGAKYVETLEERSSQIAKIEGNKYREEILACEKVNEANYNAFLEAVRNVRDNLMSIEEVAKALAAREIETTKDMGIDGSMEMIESSGLVRM